MKIAGHVRRRKRVDPARAAGIRVGPVQTFSLPDPLPALLDVLRAVQRLDSPLRRRPSRRLRSLVASVEPTAHEAILRTHVVRLPGVYLDPDLCNIGSKMTAYRASTRYLSRSRIRSRAASYPKEQALPTSALAECTCPDFCERDHDNE